MKMVGFALATASVLASSWFTYAAASACAGDLLEATLDFEGLPVGSQPTKLCFSSGISTSSSKYGSSVCIELETSGPNAGALIFDAACGGPPDGTDNSGCTGGDQKKDSKSKIKRDSDLFQPMEGNVLILQNNNNVSRSGKLKNNIFPSSLPDDDTDGGCFKFIFNTPSFLEYFASVSVASAVLLDIEETLEANFTASPGGDFKKSGFTEDGGIQTVGLDFENVQVLDVCLPGSGAIGDVVLCLDQITTTTSTTTSSLTTTTLSSSSTSTTTATEDTDNSVDPCPSGYSPATIDYENLAVGSQPKKLCFNAGISSSQTDVVVDDSVCIDLATDGENNGAMIFDAACGGPPDGTDDSGCTGGDQKPDHRSKIKPDTDLFQPQEGNVLILQRDGNVTRSGKLKNNVFPLSLPDDDMDGGCFYFNFNTDSFLKKFASVIVTDSVLLDIDQGLTTLRATAQDGSTQIARSGLTEDGGIQTVQANFMDVATLQICLRRSGALGDIGLCLQPQTTTSTSTTTSTTSSTVTSSGSTSTSTTTTTVTDELGQNIDKTESSSTTTSTATVVCPGDLVEATIDWENLPVGSAVNTVCFTQGITASASGASYDDSSVCIEVDSTGRNRGPLIFDASCDGSQSDCSGGDTDLYQPSEGNVLILQRNNGGYPSSIPNDDPNGGCFMFYFNTSSFLSKFKGIYIASATLLDIEENPVMFKAYETGAMESSEVTADGGITTTALEFSDVAMLEICLVSSGAVGDVVICVDPITTSTTTSTTSSTVTSSGTTSTSTSSTTETDELGQNVDKTESSSTSTSTSTGICPVGFVSAVIDFENLLVGSQPDKVCFSQGISGLSFPPVPPVCVDLESNGENNGAMIFDAACGGPADGTDDSGCTGGDQKPDHRSKIKPDTDLFHPQEGNVLILQRDGNVSRSGKTKNDVFPLSLPDDDTDGGCFKFTFNTSSFSGAFEKVFILSSVLMDIEETNPVDFTAYTSSGMLTVTSGITGDGGIQTTDLNFPDVQVLEVCFAGSGALGDIELCLKEKDGLRRLDELDTQHINEFETTAEGHHHVTILV